MKPGSKTKILGLIKTIKRALKLYKNSSKLEAIMKKGMKENYSWDKSAKEYELLYKTILF